MKKPGNFGLRLILFFIAVPGIFSVILLFPDYNHLLFSLIVIFFSGVGGLEMAKIFNARGFQIKEKGIAVLTSFLTSLFYINVQFPEAAAHTGAVFFFSVAIVLFFLTLEIFNADESDWKNSLNRVSAYTFILFYPGVLMGYLIKISELPGGNFSLFNGTVNNSATFLQLILQPETLAYVYLLFFVFANDTMAYLFGMLFGKKTWKPFPVSPNKSIVGYIGGIFSTMMFAIPAYYLTPDFFGGKLLYAFMLSLGVALLGNIGDLVESSLKRSAGVKDSGHIILGRGGIMDSIDSTIFAVPFYFHALFLIQQISQSSGG